MAEKITQRSIAALQPNSILWDREVRGFLARRQFSDVITYSIFFRTYDGTQRWMKIGRHPIFTPTQARHEAIRLLREVSLGNDPAGTRMALRSAPTVAELCNEYQSDMQSGKMNGKKASTIYTDINRITKHIIPGIGKLKVATISQEQIENWIQKLTPGSARRILGLTGAIFTYAVKRKLRLDNPVRGIEAPQENRKLRRLSVAEYAQLGKALEGQNEAAHIFLLLAVTGWRSGEARLLKWNELDLDRRIATLGDTKSGLSVRPLSGAAIEIIQLQPRKAEYVFAIQQGKPLNKLGHHWERLGMDKDVSPHTLRHSLASLGADLGLPDHTISGLLGHSGRGITSRYLHLGDKALLDASDLVANETLRLMRS